MISGTSKTCRHTIFLHTLTLMEIYAYLVSMYLRTTRRKNKNGSTVEYYQLAHNERHPETGKPVARVIHNFGRTDELDRDSLVRLCRSIARVCGLTVVDELNPHQMPPETFGIPAQLKIKRTYAYGCVHVVEILWERLGLRKIFADIAGRKNLRIPYERALLAMTANRLCEPESKLGVWDRWLSKVYLPSCDSLQLKHIYEAMDLFYDHAQEIEEQIFFSVANLFNLEVDLIFYDTTTASFSVDYEDSGDEPLRKYGHSKEGTWSPQVVVALAVTRDGIPVKCWVFPGDTADVSTIKRIREDLRGWKLNRALFVADAGMNSTDNRKELARACGKYLLATRMASVAEIREEVLTRRGRYTVIKDNLHAKEIIVGDGERRRRYILCYNPKEAERQKRHRDEIVLMLDQELARHPEKKASAQWAIALLASRRFKKYLSVSKSNCLRIDQGKIREAAKYDGKWVLETNDDSISMEDAACGYKGLMVIERCFRSLKKTQIKMMPMYHWAPRRIETHVRICVLSLLIERVAELECGMSWHQIREALCTLQVTEFFKLNYRFYCRNEITHEANNILNNLKISIPKRVLNIENPT